MKALISPNESPITHIVSWTGNPSYPIFEAYPNSCRVAQVEPDDQTFGVAEPLFWADCANDVVADQWYYDTVKQTVNLIVNVPKPPAEDQPTTDLPSA
jgi:hypothetical protein